MSEVEQTETVEEAKEIKQFKVYREGTSGNLELLDARFETERYQPDATQLGEAFGVGTYFCFEVKDTSRYVGIYGYRTVIEATTYYSEKYED
jgi:hypothetical protein